MAFLHHYTWHLWIKRDSFLLHHACNTVLKSILSFIFLLTWGLSLLSSLGTFLTTSDLVFSSPRLFRQLMSFTCELSPSGAMGVKLTLQERLGFSMGRVWLCLYWALTHVPLWFPHVLWTHELMDGCSLSCSFPGCPINFLRAGTMAWRGTLELCKKLVLLNDTHPFQVFTSAAVTEWLRPEMQKPLFTTLLCHMLDVRALCLSFPIYEKDIE